MYIYLVFVITILVYITLYIAKGKGLWENTRLYAPRWSEKFITYLFIYMFVLLIYNFWFVITMSSSNLKDTQTISTGLMLLLFSFMVYCLADGNDAVEEAFVLSVILLGIMIVNFMTVMVVYNRSSLISAGLPILVYLYLFCWVYEIKNTH